MPREQQQAVDPVNVVRLRPLHVAQEHSQAPVTIGRDRRGARAVFSARPVGGLGLRRCRRARLARSCRARWLLRFRHLPRLAASHR